MSDREARRLASVALAAGVLTASTLGAGNGILGTRLLGAQEAGIEGRWEGALTILGQELGFSVEFTRADGEISAKMDIPVQQAMNLDLINVSEQGAKVHFELQAGPGLAVWDGVREGEAIEGDFMQGGARGTFRIARGEAAKSSEPAEAGEPNGEPLPYRQEELTFENGDVHLEGTLTLPDMEGPFPAVVMVTGSGAQNRDEELFGFQPFRVIADHLTRDGIAVFRYDDRGVGGSTGNTALSTTSDVADDALLAIARLATHDEIDGERIGIIGHSEGGVVAPLAATRSASVAFVVLLAGTSVPGDEVIYEQLAAIGRASGEDEEKIAESLDLQHRIFAALERGEDLKSFAGEIEAAIRKGIEDTSPEEREMIADVDEFVASQVKGQLAGIQTPWFKYFLSHDPAVALRQTRVPVLALFGELDKQVTPSQNRGPMAEALSGNPDVTINVLPDANHLFLKAVTGSPDEYATMDKTFVPGFLDLITDWIEQHTAKL